MLAAIAEFEHDLIVERTQDGLAAAKARGRKGGATFKMTPIKARQVRVMYDVGEHTVQQIADTFGVSRPTIYRHFGAPGAAPSGSVQSQPQATRAPGPAAPPTK